MFKKFLAEYSEREEYSEHASEDISKLVLIQDPEYRRSKATVNIELALSVFPLYR